MIRFVGKKLQVFRMIISFIFKAAHRIFGAFMMNPFFWLKVSTKHFLHHKAMFVYIAITFSERMRRHLNKNIPIPVFDFSTLPMGIFATLGIGLTFSYFLFCFLGIFKTQMPLVLFISFFYLFEMLFCSFINAYWHNILQIKRAAFGVLERTRYVLHLRLPLIRHKKFVASLTATSIAYSGEMSR